MNTKRKYSVTYNGEFQTDDFEILMEKIDKVLEDMNSDFKGVIKVFEFNHFDDKNVYKEDQNSNI